MSLNRQNTFEIKSNSSVKNPAAVQNTTIVIQETPVSNKPVVGNNGRKIRPKLLQLDGNLHDSDSPTRFSLDLIPASTPLDVNGTITRVPETLHDNTFSYHNSQQQQQNNITWDVTKEKEHMQLNVTETIIKPINTTVTKLPAENTFNCHNNITTTNHLHVFQPLMARESLGILTESQIRKLEESLDLSEEVANRFDDKTLVADQYNSQNQLQLVKPPEDLHLEVPPPQFGSLTNIAKVAQRLSFSKYPDISLSCSFDLEEVSNPIKPTTQCEANSMEDSLGILTPDQMKDFCDTTASSRHSLDLCLVPGKNPVNLRLEQTPSPEELPLDPLPSISNSLTHPHPFLDNKRLQLLEMERSDFSEMTESAVMKSSSHLESSVITSITSLDGYQGDGEMSRPASRNGESSSSKAGSTAGSAVAPGNSPVKRLLTLPVKFQHPKDISDDNNPPRIAPEAAIIPAANNAVEDAALGPVVRRPDPMTDSDFFTESDADDIFHRGGDRRAQIIDGQLYGQQVLQNVVMVGGEERGGEGGGGGETSGMDSSGVFTDGEAMREELQFDISPDDRSTETTAHSSVNSQRMGDAEVEDYEFLDMKEDLNATIRNHREAFGDEVLVEDEHEERRNSNVTKDNYNLPVDKNNQTVAVEPTGDDATASDKMEVDTAEEEEEVVVVDNDNRSAVSVSLAVANKVSPRPVNQSGGGGSTMVSKPGATKRLNSTSRRSNSSSPPIIKKKMVEQPTVSATKGQVVRGVQGAAAALQPQSSSVKKTPNKWDAVMSKIAHNQSAAPAKNYNEIKSRVNSCSNPSKR